VKAINKDSFTRLRDESVKRLEASEKVAERQLRQARLRSSLLAAFLLVGFLVVAQWRGAESATLDLEDQSDQDLAIIIEELTASNDELREESDRLEAQLGEARADDAGLQELLNEAARELQGLRILTGLETAYGPGVALEIEDPEGVLLAQDYANVVNELRAAGAEAISVDGNRVRVTSGFASDDGGIHVDGRYIGKDVVVYAIGDPETLEQAVGMPGGLLPTLSAFPGVGVSVTLRDDLEVPAAPDDSVDAQSAS
jgi:uncharacterized protein YlxW (UPF0749 family)